MKKLYFLTVLIFIASFFTLTSVSAEGTHTMRVSPSISEVSLDPGASLEKNISVVNKGSVPFELKLSVAPYSVINEKYVASFEPLPGRPPVNTWFSFDVDETAKVQPGKFYDVKYKLTVPASTAPGGYSAVIFAESTADTKVDTGIVAKNRIAHIVYITVNGDVKREGTVTVEPVPFVTLNTQQEVRDIASNIGGTNEKARITTKISDVFGRNVMAETTERYVLPGTKRAISLEWRSASVFGIYKIERSAEFAGANPIKRTQWTVVIQPLFFLLGLVLVIGVVWLNYKKTRTIKARHGKK